MWSTDRACSNPIYEIINKSTFSSVLNQPLRIDIEPISHLPTMNFNQIPLLLLGDCQSIRPSSHNYVNQRIDEELENLDPVYAKPRKRCATLRNDPMVIPPKTSRSSVTSIKPERAQVVSTTIPTATVLSSSDEIDRFVARENDRVERVKLRRRQKRQPSAFSNPNYADTEQSDPQLLSQSILV